MAIVVVFFTFAGAWGSAYLMPANNHWRGANYNPTSFGIYFGAATGVCVRVCARVCVRVCRYYSGGRFLLGVCVHVKEEKDVQANSSGTRSGTRVGPE